MTRNHYQEKAKKIFKLTLKFLNNLGKIQTKKHKLFYKLSKQK